MDVEIEHVWATGTGPGGEAGVIYEGGSGQRQIQIQQQVIE